LTYIVFSLAVFFKISDLSFPHLRKKIFKVVKEQSYNFLITLLLLLLLFQICKLPLFINATALLLLLCYLLLNFFKLQQGKVFTCKCLRSSRMGRRKEGGLFMALCDLFLMQALKALDAFIVLFIYTAGLTLASHSIIRKTLPT
jgi:hypothetical protein